MPYEPGQAIRARELEEFYPDVPSHLQRPLLEWTVAVIRAVDRDALMRIGVLLRAGTFGGSGFDMSALSSAIRQNPAIQLVVIEDLLARYEIPGFVDQLGRYLEDGHSAYEINSARTGLTWRVDPTTMEQVRRAVQEAPPTPARWLTDAWNAAYALHPNPRQAYDSAILAVESAYGPTVIPLETHYQLGKIISVIRDSRANDKFTVDLEDARPTATGVEPPVHSTDAVLQMLRAISFGQRVRHGTDGANVTINSADEARVAVQLAATLVQIASSESFRLTTP